jgi:hypothetical protein
MQTYKEWRRLNESIGLTLPLGMAKTPTVGGVVGSRLGPDFENELEEGKSSCKGKSKKKMLGDVEDVTPMLKKKKGLKPKITAPEDGDEVVDDVEDVEDDVEDVEDDVEDVEGDVEDVEGDVEDELEDEEGGEMMLSKKKAKKGAKKCAKKSAKKKMTKEEVEWAKSVIRQLNSDLNPKFSDGLNLEEDKVVAPQNANDDLIDDQEPGPGDMGYAPQQRLGWFMS